MAIGNTNDSISRQVADDYELAHQLATAQLLNQDGVGLEKQNANRLFSNRNSAGNGAPDSNGQTSDTLFAAQLQERADFVRRKQEEWCNSVVQQSRLLESTSRSHYLQIKNERDESLRLLLEAHQQVIAQEEAERRARLAERVEQQRRAFEEQQRARAEAEAARRAELAAEVERRRRQREDAQRIRREIEREERRAREEAEAARLAQIAAEEERIRRQREEAERIRRERQRECAVCLEENDTGEMVEIPCRHWYCREHLRGESTLTLIILNSSSMTTDALQAALSSRRPFQCCRTTVPLDSLQGLLQEDAYNQYRDMLEETSTPNPIYCSNRDCSAFIPAANARGPDLIECHRCDRATCRHCRNRYHPGTECAADVDTQRARSLAAAQGWKACPNCSNMVEKSSGCLHMTCRCGTEFCYRCGQHYRSCRGRCPPRD